jgi:hypothetical protein
MKAITNTTTIIAMHVTVDMLNFVGAATVAVEVSFFFCSAPRP